ncbi:MAG: transcriptional repressor [Euryarchaeota archaeon]|nr:transcriptional repressor [Euryarchaeota archaeon]
MNGKATRWTRQLKLVIDIVYESADPMIAEEVYRLARKKMPNISLGTVYRNLNKLVEEGLVSESSSNGISTFSRHPFPNSTFECSVCHRLSSVPVDLNVLELTRKVRMKVDRYSLQLVGVCRDCDR